MSRLPVGRTAMSDGVRLATALALSMVAGGAVQQILMMVVMGGHQAGLLAPLAAFMLLVTVVFAVARRKALPLDRIMVLLVAVFSIAGAGALAIGVATFSPEVGGNILYLVALLLDVGFVVPAVLAVLLHWVLLRAAPAAR